MPPTNRPPAHLLPWIAYRDLPEGSRRDQERDRLYEANIRLVGYALKYVRYQQADKADLVQVGRIALAEMIDRFDPDRGNRFSTAAVKWIIGRMRGWLRKYRWGAYEWQQAVDQGQPVRAHQEPPMSLGQTIPERGDLPVESRLVGTVDVEETAVQAAHLETIYRCLDRLPDHRMKPIILGRFIERYTQGELAQQFSCSKQWIGRLEKEGLRLLRLELAAEGLTLSTLLGWTDLPGEGGEK